MQNNKTSPHEMANKEQTTVYVKGRNGFSCPLHWQQVLVWAVSLGNVALVFTIFLMQKVLPRGVTTSVLVVFSLLSCMIVIVNYWVTAACVQDPIIQKQLNFKAQGKRFSTKKAGVDGRNLNLWCNLCKAFVNDSTKHCGLCNQCTLSFDHHCNWLNNCIGA